MLANFLALVLLASPAFGSVAYISNCCNHPSTISVFRTATHAQIAQWTVGLDATSAVFAPDGTKLYVSDAESKSISVIQVSTGDLTATIPVAGLVESLLISPDGTRLYGESIDPSEFVAIDTTTNTLIATVVLQYTDIYGFAISPDGREVYSSDGSAGLAVIDTASFALSTLPVPASGVAVTPDGKFLYTTILETSESTGNLTIVNANTGAVTQTIPLAPGYFPYLVTITPDGTQAWLGEYKATGGASRIEVVSTSTFALTGFALPPNSFPGNVVFSPNSTTAYLTVSGGQVDEYKVAEQQLVAVTTSAGGAGTPAISPDGTLLIIPNSGGSALTAIDAATEKPLTATGVGSMEVFNSFNSDIFGGVAVSADGTRVYLTNYSSQTLSAIDTASKKLIKSVPVGSEPLALVVSPDNSKVYVANSSSDSVSVIATSTFKVETISLPGALYGYPSSIAITPDGTRLYVSVNNLQPDFGVAACYILAIDTSSNQVVNSTRIHYPMALTVSPDGTTLYVLGGETDTLYTISTATNEITNELKLSDFSPEQPVTGGIAIAPNGAELFATDGISGTVFEVNLATNTLLKEIAVGQQPGSVAVTPDGAELWVTDLYETSASIINVASGLVTGAIPLGNQSFGIAFGPQ
jgi:YVTN family beta-propeller protein